VAVREVLRFPHPVLKERARPLRPDELDDGLRVVADLLDTMHAHERCVGLAAPQIGEPVRVVVVDVRRDPKRVSENGLVELVNPLLVRTEGDELGREGCLSIPDLTANVRRAVHVAIEALTPAGEPVEISTEGFEARCLLHEIDHLDGVLFLDRVDSLATDVFRRKSYG
jgi:peptide deformylase